ncbi:WxL domain-containing protein [Cryobacterium sp. PH29-G1]|uniref:WxL domain-containing protein n=1 Tax=Cryobacterium sp. PH29-G1 TaxID=3046211 RepID=UPI0024BA2C2B|nr:WxL domain-containing protein [Cryobacterium sp. PH29-G1]MDJ0349787.1 WxL domain-containing protein [Cryobacterium sp. PH29-G1]
MHAFTKTAGIIITTGILFGVALSPAQAVDNTDTINATVSAGNLTANPTAPTAMTAVVLDGINAKTSTGTAATWTITNARGTNTAWSLSASATDFVSAAGTVDTTARVLPASNLVITPGVIVAGAGSDVAPTASALTMSNVAQSLVYTTTLGKGSFALSPAFKLNVPANAYRSNYSAAVGTTAVNPYVSTITFTIA